MNWTAIKQGTADLARPFVLYSVGGAVTFSVVHIALDGKDLAAGTGFIAAALAGLAVLYGAKAVEETRKSGHSAEVAKTQAVEAAKAPVLISNGSEGPAAEPDHDPTEFGGPRP